jgi:hypothetical protein
MMLVAAAVLVIGALIFTLLVRTQDLPEPEPVSPVKHLEERKATIYENLRDLQFEYRVGKLSEVDYQQTKKDLQKELATVLAEIDAVQGTAPPAPAASRTRSEGPPATAPRTEPRRGNVASREPRQSGSGVLCPHCGARFASAMKFCGNCGKPLQVEASK